MIRKLFLKYRLHLGLLFILLGVLFNFTNGISLAWIFYFIALVLVFTHFFLGPLGLAQGYLEEGDLEGAEVILNKIQFPGLLYKPIRSTYYFLKSIISSTRQDLDEAEDFMQKCVSLGTPMKEVQAQAFFQLGNISYQKSKMKKAKEYLRKAVNAGLPDRESRAAAYIQLASISISSRDMRNARRYHKLCKKEKPTSTEVVMQLKQLDKYISRMPG
ncbi:MAG TPA: hypothetical protein VK084_06410 [Chitinophagaceae bacterium]|nr:hypothetical protein [Chitinophagaceae bacterium]